MVKNDNPHALRFLQSMEKHNRRDDADNFAEEYPLSKSANIDKKFIWAQQLCEFMSRNYDDETIRAIRMDCACGPELGKAKKIKNIYENETDLIIFEKKRTDSTRGFLLNTMENFYISAIRSVIVPV